MNSPPTASTPASTSTPRPMTSSRSRARWAAMTIGQQGIAGTASLVFLIASSTSLSLRDRGLLALALSAATIAGTLAPLGMTHAFLHFGGLGFSPGSVARPFVRELTGATALLGVAAAVVVRTLTHADLAMTIACGVSVAVYSALQLTQAALYGLAEVRTASLRRSVGSAMLLIGALTLTVTGVKQPVVWLGVWTASIVASALLQLAALTHRRVDPLGRAELARGEVTAFCWRAAPLNLSYVLAGRVDLWVVGVVLDMERVAVYSAALGVVELASIFGQGLASSFQIKADGAMHPPLRLFGVLSATQAIIALLGWGAISLATTEFFGNDAGYGYGDMGLPLIVLAAASGPLAFQRMYAAWLAGAGAASSAVGSTVVMAIAVGLFAWSLTPALGVPGAALASLLGYTFGATALLLPGRTSRWHEPAPSGI